MNLNKQETATVRAALRYWQKKIVVEREIDANFGNPILSIDDVPEYLRDYFEAEFEEKDIIPLEATEIDALCEHINFHEDAPKTFVMMSMQDGNDQTPLEATEYTAALSEALEIAGYGVLTSVEIPEHLGE